MKCIAVDDEALALKVLVDAIEEAIPNVEIFKTKNPSEALEYASKNVIDIAFCDITMHTMNGIELAKHLKKYNPKLNIIFVTGYGEFLPDAFALHASGYITKPVSKDDILREMANLLHPIQSEVSGIYAKTFGNFELFVNGKPVFFAREKSKEMLAYFIDRRGAMESKKEIIATLFEDRPYNRELQNYFTKIYGDLVRGLKEVGAEKILIKGYNKYGVDKTKFGCDLYEYLEGNPIAINNFSGEYMIQYEWAEYSIGNLYE